MFSELCHSVLGISQGLRPWGRQGLCHQGSPATSDALVATGRVKGEEQEILKKQKQSGETKRTPEAYLERKDGD